MLDAVRVNNNSPNRMMVKKPTQNNLYNSLLDFESAYELLLRVCVRPGDLPDRP